MAQFGKNRDSHIVGFSQRYGIKKNLLNGYDIVRFDETVASIAADGKRLQKTNFTNFPTTAISGFYDI